MSDVASEPLSPTVIALSGEYDIDNADSQLAVALAPAKSAMYVVLDFSGVRYIDSTGITLLIRMHKQRAASGLPDAHLAALRANVKYVFELVSLDRFLRVFDTVADAIAAFDAARVPPQR